MGEPWSNARRVRAYLKKHRVNCPGCGYDLHGVERGACPECGRALLIEELVFPPPTSPSPSASGPHAEAWNHFRLTVCWIGGLWIVVAVFYLVLTFPFWLQPRGVKVLAAPGLGVFVMHRLLTSGQRAYTEGRWPEFARTMVRDTVILVLFLCGVGLLLWLLLNLIWP